MVECLDLKTKCCGVFQAVFFLGAIDLTRVVTTEHGWLIGTRDEYDGGIGNLLR